MSTLRELRVGKTGHYLEVGSVLLSQQGSFRFHAESAPICQGGKDRPSDDRPVSPPVQRPQGQVQESLKNHINCDQLVLGCNPVHYQLVGEEEEPADDDAAVMVGGEDLEGQDHLDGRRN